MYGPKEPPGRVAAYFDEIGTYTVIVQIFRPGSGWTALRGTQYANQITTELCCQLAEEGVTAVQVGGWRHPNRQSYADFQMRELVDDFDLLARHSCTC